VPGQRNWIVLLIAGAVAVLFGVGMTLAGYRAMIASVPFGLALVFVGVVQSRKSRRFVQESMRNAVDELRDAGD
jgi:hypothetical protein